MQYARFEVDKRVFEAREKSVHLDGVFGDVYAPKSKIVVEGERKPDMATNTFVQFLVPCWVFWNKTQNPCQFTGFIEQINMKEQAKSKLLTVEGLIAELEANGWEETTVTCPDGAKARISPCCYYGEKNLQNCEYFLLYWDMPWGGSDKIERLVDQLNRHAELRKEIDRDKEELRAYFDEHQANGWDGESFSFYSDWHKDLFGYRPHGKVFGQYINPHAV